MTTKRQKYALHFCEDILHISYKGDLEDMAQVSAFLGKYLNRAKEESKYIDVYYNDIKIGVAKNREEAKLIADKYKRSLITVIEFRERPYIG